MKIGILGALSAEIFPSPATAETQLIAEKQFRQFSHLGHQLVLAQSGVGKVNAALTATVLLQHFQCEFVFCIGIAGSLDPTLQLNDILIAEELHQHDYGSLIDGIFRPARSGTHPIKNKKAPKAFRISKALKSQIQKLNLNIYWGTLISGDIFVKKSTGSLLLQQFNAQAVDMESAAVAQVAECFHRPFLAIRCISDLVSAPLEHPVPLPHSAITNLHQIVNRILEELSQSL